MIQGWLEIIYTYVYYFLKFAWVYNMFLAWKFHLISLVLLWLLFIVALCVSKLLYHKLKISDFLSGSHIKLLLYFLLFHILFVIIGYGVAWSYHGNRIWLTISKYLLYGVIVFFLLKNKTWFNIWYFLVLIIVLFIFSYFPLYYLWQYLIDIYPTHPALFEFLYGVERI